MFKPIHLFLIGSFFVFNGNARQIIPGNNQIRGNNTFSFPVKAHCIDKNHTLYVGACAGDAQEYALSKLRAGDEQCLPVASREVIYNGKKDQPNPLFNAPIAHLASIDSANLALVLAEQNCTLYNLNFGTPTELLSADPADANGKPSAEICALATDGTTAVFAAVKGSGQPHFGGSGAGIALMVYNQQTTEYEVSDEEYSKIQKAIEQATTPEEKKELFGNIKQDNDGKRKRSVTTKSFAQKNKTIPINRESDFLKIGGDLQAIGDKIALHWHEGFRRLYVGLQATSGSTNNDGARAIAVGHIENEQLVLCPIVGADVFRPGACNEIVGAHGAGATVTIHHIASMLTTTFLDYLIVHGGNGDPEHTARRVYALPILNLKQENGMLHERDLALQGTLADPKTAQAVYGGKRSKLFKGRHFTQPAKSAGQMATTDDPAACVGAGPLQAGPIADILVHDDAVYALVTNADQGYQNGVYQSQAIIGPDGVVVSWTMWSLGMNMDDAVSWCAFERKFPNMLAISNRNTISRTSWHLDQDDEFAAHLNNQFCKENGGIHELIEWDTPELGQPLLCTIGCKTIALGHLKDNSVTVFANNDVLAELGPLSTAEVAIGNTGWLFVGGVHGLAALADSDGNGWNTADGLKHFDQLQGMKFIKVGDYQFVRKIIYDEHYLYILTDAALDRIDLNSFDVFGPHNAVRLATAANSTGTQHALLKDCIISQKFALIAHTAGLDRIGDGKDIRTDTQETISWQALPVSKELGQIVGLYPFCKTGRAQDCARDASQLYVLCGDRSKNLGYLCRFAIRSVINKPVDEGTIMPLPDYMILGSSRNCFVQIGFYSNVFATDGASFFTVPETRDPKTPLAFHNFGRSKVALPLDIENSSKISRIMRSSCGSWLIAGDFGLRINR